MISSAELLQGRLVRLYPRLARHAVLIERGPLVTAVVTATLGLAVFLLVLLTGGAPNSFIQLAYIPITFAAFRGGLFGGVLSAAIGALMVGPLMAVVDLEGNGEYGVAWLVRGSMFVAVGAVLGWLFTEARTRTMAWREAALEVTSSQQEGMLALARAAEAKDPTTGDHLYRCRDLAERIAIEAGLEPLQVADIAWSAMLHDIGKLYVPDHVLVKPAALTLDEWALIREHPVRGAEILAHGRMFETARRIARWHHENLDGSGYPDGLRGSAIPLEARIVRIADAWDAMTNDRPYRAALTRDQAMEELRSWAGRAFDPDLVEVFLAYLERGQRVQV